LDYLDIFNPARLVEANGYSAIWSEDVSTRILNHIRTHSIIVVEGLLEGKVRRGLLVGPS
jgi:hypothetical protein